MSSNIVWHEASITKEERRSKINIKALFYGLRVYLLQEIISGQCICPTII